MWNSSRSEIKIPIHLNESTASSLQNEVAMQANESSMDFYEKNRINDYANKSKRSQGKGTRGTYKPRSKVKHTEKCSSSNSSNQPFQSVFINPEILRRLGYTSSAKNLNEQTFHAPIHESIFNQELIQNQPNPTPEPSTFINDTTYDPCCLNPHELLHPNDPNRNNKFYFSFLDLNEQRLFDNNKNINQENFDGSSSQSYLDLNSIRKTNSDENLFSFHLSKDN